MRWICSAGPSKILKRLEEYWRSFPFGGRTSTSCTPKLSKCWLRTYYLAPQRTPKMLRLRATSRIWKVTHDFHPKVNLLCHLLCHETSVFSDHGQTVGCTGYRSFLVDLCSKRCMPWGTVVLANCYSRDPKKSNLVVPIFFCLPPHRLNDKYSAFYNGTIIGAALYLGRSS